MKAVHIVLVLFIIGFAYSKRDLLEHIQSFEQKYSEIMGIHYYEVVSSIYIEEQDETGSHVIVVVLLQEVGSLYLLPDTHGPMPVKYLLPNACGEETITCSDGSIVGRDPLDNCKFVQCPVRRKCKLHYIWFPLLVMIMVYCSLRCRKNVLVSEDVPEEQEKELVKPQNSDNNVVYMPISVTKDPSAYYTPELFPVYVNYQQ